MNSQSMSTSRLAQLTTELIEAIIYRLHEPASFSRVCRRFYHIAHSSYVKARYLLELSEGCPQKAAAYGLRYRFFDDDVIAILDMYWARSIRQRRRVVLPLDEMEPDYDMAIAPPTIRTKRTAHMAELEEPEYELTAPKISLVAATLPHGMFHRGGTQAEARCWTRLHIYLTRGGSVDRAAFAVALAAKRNWPRVIRLLFEYDQNDVLIRSRGGPVDADSIDGMTNRTSSARSNPKRMRIRESSKTPTTPAELALVHCARVGEEALLDLLLGYGVRPCVEALHSALEKYQWRIVNKLVSAGVVPDMSTLDLMNSQMGSI
ncbi:hypothetical protein BDF19DRAFT_437641 [Syncephalis fuscata]|nr:hypothetical protein BDF19DRAFT_437641 [Syncephalis fuscata]